LAVAILAVAAGLSSLYGGRLADSLLQHGNEAVLAQTKASDTWAEYQADSLKAHLASEFSVVAASAAIRARFDAEQRKYRTRQVALGTQARQFEAERSDLLDQMRVTERKKLAFDVAVALFQVSIVLASIAVMAKRPALLVIGAIIGAAAVVSCVVGLVR
jgi:hypothetical protein